MADATCSIDGCDGPCVGRGWCRKHYTRWWIHGDPHTVIYMRGAPLIDRWASKVYVVHPLGCWWWTGGTDNGGYGIMHVSEGGKKHKRKAHRLAWEMLVGPIPEGLDIDHVCRNRICVNPDHLEPVTRRENVYRSPRTNAAKTHCVNGHRFDKANTFATVDRATGRPRRTCRICRLRSDRKRRPNRKAG